MADKYNKFIPGRSFFIAAVALVCCIGLAIRLFTLQIINYDYYQNKVLANVQKETTVTASRGIIYDRNMIQLATNYTVYRIFVSPRDIKDDAQAVLIAQNLSEILGVAYDTVYAETQKSKYADRTIKRNVEEEDANRVLAFVTENNLNSQVHLEAGSKRYYPYGSLAAQVIGFCGTDGGLLGLELKYDNYLTGTPGRYVTAKDARGRTMDTKYESYIEAQDGNSLITTIDMPMQAMLEEQLEATYNDSSPLNRVTGIIMDVDSGAIRAMGTWPPFDLNSPYTLDASSQQKLDEMMLDIKSEAYDTAYKNLLYKMWSNKAVTDLYEPGSTFKVITTAMARQEGKVHFDDIMECPGYKIVSGIKIKCHRIYGHGTVTYARGLQQSCNPCLMTVAANLGVDTFYDYFEQFGYTSKTGIDLPAEAGGIYHARTAMHDVELACYSFGQTFKTTALQQITAIAAVANGGRLVTPYVVERIVDGSGNTVFQHETEVKRQIISEDICAEISAVLEEGVSTDGGAKNAYVPGYKIAAKTGTSEVRDILDEEGNSYLRVGSTVAYAPSDDPQIIMIIIVDQPQCENIYGSYVAAPYIATLMSEVLPYIGVEVNYTETDLSKMAVTLRNYVGLTTNEVTVDLYNRGIKYTVEGDGDYVTYQVPLGGSSLNPKTGKVILYTGTATPDEFVAVPNVIGKTAVQANNAITNVGLNILYSGSVNFDAGNGAMVISQTPAAGEQVPYGTVVTVELRHLDSDDISQNFSEDGDG